MSVCAIDVDQGRTRGHEARLMYAEGHSLTEIAAILKPQCPKGMYLPSNVAHEMWRDSLRGASYAPLSRTGVTGWDVDTDDPVLSVAHATGLAVLARAFADLVRGAPCTLGAVNHAYDSLSWCRLQALRPGDESDEEGDHPYRERRRQGDPPLELHSCANSALAWLSSWDCLGLCDGVDFCWEVVRDRIALQVKDNERRFPWIKLEQSACWQLACCLDAAGNSSARMYDLADRLLATKRGPWPGRLVGLARAAVPSRLAMGIADRAIRRPWRK